MGNATSIVGCCYDQEQRAFEDTAPGQRPRIEQMAIVRKREERKADEESELSESVALQSTQQSSEAPDIGEEKVGVVEKPELEDDIMKRFDWDGPEDSDEEVAEMVEFKNQYEKELGIRFSKRGIVTFIEDLISRESI